MVEKSLSKIPKFLLTREVGKMAKWLRILGFDARYEPSGHKSFVMIEALKEERIVITRNLRFGARHGGTVIFIKSNELKTQLQELLILLSLEVKKEKLFSRCIVCNEALKDIEKNLVKNEVPPYVYQTQEEFKKCFHCHRIYWKGTHWGNVEEVIKKLSSSAS